MINFWISYAFEPLAYTLDLRCAQNRSFETWDFENVSRSVEIIFIYENNIFLSEVAANDFPVMTADQICTEDIINSVVIATDVENVVDERT